MGGKPIVTGKAIERKLQHDLRRARRPPAFAFRDLEAFQKTADIQEQAGKLRANCFKRMLHALSSRDDRFRRKRCPMTAGPAIDRNRIRPVRRCSRHKVCVCKISPQPFARLQLMRLNHRAPVAATPPGEPGQRTFVLIDSDFGAPVSRSNLPFRKSEVLGTKIVDLRSQ
jgi:hypothetical protein